MKTYFLKGASDARQKFSRPASGANELPSHSSRLRRSPRVTDSRGRENFGESRQNVEMTWRRTAPAGDAAGGPAGAPGLSKVHISSCQRGMVEIFAGASFLCLHSESIATGVPIGGKRKEVTELSDASRRRLMDLLAKVDETVLPVFVTLTYPDEFPADHEMFKRHLDNLGQRLRRRWPESAFVWKLEFQTRKSGRNKGKVAPHYHLFLYNVPLRFPFKVENRSSYRVAFRVADDGSRYVIYTTRGDDWEETSARWQLGSVDEPDEDSFDELKEWMSRTWYDIVGSRNRNHFHAGTRVEELRCVRAAFAYAAKRYIAKKEDSPRLSGKPGRFWGVVGRRSLRLGKRILIELDAEQAVRLRRTIRRYRRANTNPEKRKFGRKGSGTVRLYCVASNWLKRLSEIVEVRRADDGRFLPTYELTAVVPEQIPAETEKHRTLHLNPLRDSDSDEAAVARST